MAGFSASTSIAASASDVFGVVSDLASHPGWSADELTVERTGDRTWRTTSRAKGRTFFADVIVTVTEPDRTFEFVASDETGTYRHRIIVEPVAGGCRVTRTVTAERLGFGQAALFWLTLIPVRRPALRASLARLTATFG